MWKRPVSCWPRGWKPGPDGILVKDGQRFTFTIITNNGTEVRRDIATLIQDNFRQIGIEVKIELYEWAVFLKNFINKGDFDAMVLGWALGPDYDQYQIWHSSQTNPEQLNVVGYKNPRSTSCSSTSGRSTTATKSSKWRASSKHHLQGSAISLSLRPAGNLGAVEGQLPHPPPDGKGGWIDSPVEMTKAGWSYYSEWFYRPEYADKLPR